MKRELKKKIRDMAREGQADSTIARALKLTIEEVRALLDASRSPKAEPPPVVASVPHYNDVDVAYAVHRQLRQHAPAALGSIREIGIGASGRDGLYSDPDRRAAQLASGLFRAGRVGL